MSVRAIVAHILLLGWVSTFVGCGKKPGERYILPNGYAGWVEVEYGVLGAPSLPRDAKGFRIARVPDSGIVQTMDPPLYGEGYLREYVYEVDEGRTVLAD